MLLAAGLVAGCAGYYLQAAAGQAAVMRERKPIENLLADPATPPGLRRQLLVVDAALLFARIELALPASGSYRHYTDLKRPYVLWNVVAAPEFSLEAREWCQPIAGCTTYRGWFSEERARQEAAQLAARGNDVHVGGVTAYSTLGWFDDPVLNTMLAEDDTALAGLLFHELAHQRLYVPGDTPFNESFATAVEEEGARRWLASRHDDAGLCQLMRRQARRAAALGILAALRAKLTAIYTLDQPGDDRRRARAAAFDEARADYAALRVNWPSPPWFDGWFAPGLNNARLAALSSYEDDVPAFRSLLAGSGGDLEQFYARVEALGKQSPDARRQVLDGLAGAPEPVVSESATAGSGCRAGR